MPEETIEIARSNGSARLALYRRGAGPGILFLHGWVHSAAVWQEVIPHFEETNTCVAVDLPGFGESARLTGKDITFEVYAQIVWELLQVASQRFGVDRVVADSMSGVLMLDCMSRFESMPVKRVFLSGVPLDGLPRLIREGRAHAITGTGLRVLRGLPFLVAHFLTSRGNYLTVHQRGKFERVITDMVRRSNPTTAGRLLREMYYPYELSEHFAPGRYAVTLCRGAHDQVFLQSSIEPWAKALGAHPATIPDAGHTPMLENADDYARAIAAAWQRSEATPMESSER